MKTFLIYTFTVLLGIMILCMASIIAYWAYLIHWAVGLFTIWLEIIALCLTALDALDALDGR